MGGGAQWPDLCEVCHAEGERVLLEKRISLVPAAIQWAGVPPIFRRPDLKLPAEMASIQFDGRGLFLFGDKGVGKSMTLALLMRSDLEEWATEAANQYEKELPDAWRWVDYPAFIMEIQDAFKNGEGDKTAFRLLKGLAEIPNLVIDDLGVEKITAFVAQATYYLLDQREKWLRRTFITSNHALSELDGQYGARISDRIAGMCIVREVRGKSRRIAK